MDAKLTASLPADAPIPMPEASAWRRWAAEVKARLRCDTGTGWLYLTRVELSAWQGIDLPRQWDNSDRELDRRPEPQLAHLAGRVRRALQAWEGCLRYLRLPVCRSVHLPISQRRPQPR